MKRPSENQQTMVRFQWLAIVGLVFALWSPMATPSAGQSEDVVEFRELVLDEPATSMSLTDDGRFLLLTHQSAHFVSIYDVLKKRVVTTVPCLSPRSIICRGDRIFVANDGEGKVSVLSRRSNWQLIDELQLPNPNIEHLAAAQRERFDGRLIVTCRLDDRIHGNRVYLVDVEKDKARELAKASLAEVSADGRLVMIQTLYRNDGFGGLSAFNYAEFTRADGSREPVYRGGNGAMPYIYQQTPGGFWYSQSDVWGGVPIAHQHHQPDGFIIPDRTGEVFYSLTPDVIKCIEVRTDFPEIGMKRVRYPSRFQDFSMINNHRDRMCDQPFAVVHEGRLYLFTITARGAGVLTAETALFERSNKKR